MLHYPPPLTSSQIAAVLGQQSLRKIDASDFQGNDPQKILKAVHQLCYNSNGTTNNESVSEILKINPAFKVIPKDYYALRGGRIGYELWCVMCSSFEEMEMEIDMDMEWEWE